MPEKIIQDHKHIVLPLFPMSIWKITDGLCWCFRKFSWKIMISLRLSEAVHNLGCFDLFWSSNQMRDNLRFYRTPGWVKKAKWVCAWWSYRILYVFLVLEAWANSGVIMVPIILWVIGYPFEYGLKGVLFFGICHEFENFMSQVKQYFVNFNKSNP